MNDFTFACHGTIWLLHEHTDAAKAWADENLPEDATQWGPRGTVVESRYVADIYEGICQDGLTVKAVTP